MVSYIFQCYSCTGICQHTNVISPTICEHAKLKKSVITEPMGKNFHEGLQHIRHGPYKMKVISFSI